MQHNMHINLVETETDRSEMMTRVVFILTDNVTNLKNVTFARAKENESLIESNQSLINRLKIMEDDRLKTIDRHIDDIRAIEEKYKTRIKNLNAKIKSLRVSSMPPGNEKHI